MADYKYTGLSAYILENELNAERFHVLGEAIELINMSGVEQKQPENKDMYLDVVSTDSYRYLYANDHICYVDEECLPLDTPAQYSKLSITNVTIKGTPMIKLYVPVVAKQQRDIDNFIFDGLVPTLNRLFDDELLSIKIRSAAEYQQFADATETIVKSVEERMVIPA